MTPQETTALLNLAITEASSIINGLKVLFGRHNPGTPSPTSEEVIAAYHAAFESSLLKDEQWLRDHQDYP